MGAGSEEQVCAPAGWLWAAGGKVGVNEKRRLHAEKKLLVLGLGSLSVLINLTGKSFQSREMRVSS